MLSNLGGYFVSLRVVVFVGILFAMTAWVMRVLPSRVGMEVSLAVAARLAGGASEREGSSEHGELSGRGRTIGVMGGVMKDS